MKFGYVRDFFADNKGMALKDAIKCRHWTEIGKSVRYGKNIG